jgi:enoyl-CoA hydratase/carnithine racemase
VSVRVELPDGHPHVAVVTIDRPEAANALDPPTTIPASQRLARGERLDDETFAAMRDVGTATLVDFDVGVPLVCAVNGHARAGGFDLMLASDIRFAVPQATFALEEVALGLYPTGHATVLLSRQIPWVHAQALLLTARPIDAERAREIGLVNAIVLPDDLMAAAPRPRPGAS